MVKRTHLLGFIALFSSLAMGETNWTGGVRPGGGGFYLSAPDQGFNLNFLGYGQFGATVFDPSYRFVRPDAPFDFSLRRARLTTLATVHRDVEFMVELGTPTMRAIPSTVPSTTPPDFGLVEARVSLNVFEDWFQLRVGKFTGPFSRENSKSARNLDFIERANILSSLLLAPALDTQLGAMFFGRAAAGIVNYYIGIFNGNGTSIASASDNNAYKEIQAKLEFHPHKNMMFGFGYDTDHMPASPFSLVDHSLTPILAANVSNRRHGLEIDWDLQVDWFSWKNEILFFAFPDTLSLSNYVRALVGGYSQFGFQVAGDTDFGLQILGRYEYSKILMHSSFELHSMMIGFNLFINSNLTNMINYVCEYNPTGLGGGGHYGSTGFHHILLEQLMVRF